MYKRHLFLKIVVGFFVLMYTTHANAQRARIDSIIAVIKSMDVSKSIDTARFNSIKTVLAQTKLDAASVASLEKAGEHLRKSGNIYLLYSLKLAIMTSLTATDKAHAIAFGKRNLKLVQATSNPLVLNIRSAFLRGLRIPYRTSTMLDDGFMFFNEKLKEYKLKNDSAGLADCYYVLGGFYRTKGLMETAVYNIKKSVSYMDSTAIDSLDSSEFPNPLGRNQVFNNTSVIGIYYMLAGEYKQALKYLTIAFKGWSERRLSNVPANIAMVKLLSGTTDSVNYLLDYALNQHDVQSNKGYITFALQVKAFYKIQTNELAEAEALLEECWRLIRENNIPANAPAGTNSPDYYLALIRIKQNRIPDAIAALQKDMQYIKVLRLDMLRDYKLLSTLQEQQGDFRQAAISYNSFILLQDSLLQDQKKYSSLNFETEQQMNEKELSINKLQNENTIAALTRNFTIGIAALFLILAGFVYYRYKSKQKANQKLEQILADLKLTQQQLIQSEKMASLGELTAGIAHEIQNPLNFVNNFSEVSMELIEEVKSEKLKAQSERDEQLEIELFNDITQNLQKIAHHGKRADGIVKGMLQHSRASSNQKEFADVNKLADEYLRLAYHGLRAKDKSFNAELVTNFDQKLPLVEIVPQDIGRVLLNLFTNAFYAVQERNKEERIRNKDTKFKPTVEISTKLNSTPSGGGGISVSVKDNGTGIPEHIKDKIMQPFFTTKPTGEGTGLGLSMSYDIVVKAHGGTINVNSEEGEFTEFTIAIPITPKPIIS